jgi:transcriptional regulator with XRE-family HTH domain
MSDTNRELIQALIALRGFLGLNQDAFSKRVGCSRVSISNMERSGYAPEQTVLEFIEKLNLTPETLLEWYRNGQHISERVANS